MSVRRCARSHRARSRYARILLAAAGLLALHHPALAAETARPADEPTPLRGFVSLHGKQIPLPEGEWRLAGRAVFTPAGLTAPDAVTSLGLLRLRGNTVEAAVLIQVASPGADTAWGKAPGCERSDLPLARVRYASDHDGACAWTASVAPDVVPGDAGAADPAWEQSVAEAERRGWSMPASWVMAGFRITDPRDAVQMRYAFDGGSATPDSASDPAPGPTSTLAPAPPDAAWVEAAWPLIDLGFRNRLDATASLPDWTARHPTTPSGDEADAGAGFSRTVWKTITFRSVVTTLDFSSNYVALGDAAAAAGLSAFGFVIGPFVYLGHEMAWERFGGTAFRPVELPGLGRER